MMDRRQLRLVKSAVLAGCLMGCAACSEGALAQSASTENVQPTPAVAHPVVRHVSPYRPVSLTMNAKKYYEAALGIEDLLVRRTASGNVIRFSFRVKVPGLAQALCDDHATPYLYGERSRAILHIPVMEKVGKLRQTGTAEAGKEYWMVFSNKGDLVRVGDRVNVIIGNVHVDGLAVE